MTKYVLHGGETKQASANNDRFFREMVRGFDTRAHILLVYFASAKSRWTKLAEQDKRNFAEAAPAIRLRFIVASDDADEFVQQVKAADIVYMRGGRDLFIHSFLRQIPDFGRLLEEKVVGGSSAGAQVLSRYYYTRREGKVKEGLGILPIKTCAHSNTVGPEEIAALKAHESSVNLLLLPETEFVVMRQ